jgi:hypothetical protein
MTNSIEHSKDVSMDVALSPNNHFSVQEAAVQSITQFGDLAIPLLEQYIESLEPGPVTIKFLLNILAGINTSASAKLLIKLYEFQDKSLDIKISLTLAQMLKNPFIEEELLDIGINDLPDCLQKNPPDSNGWPYEKQPSSAFSHIDRKMREDISSVYSDFGTKDRQDDLGKGNFLFSQLSFKILFPSFLSYLQSLKNNEDMPSEQLLKTIGYNTSENAHEIYALCKYKQIHKNSSLSLALEYVLKDIGSDSEASFKETKGPKWIKGIANVYFVLVLGWSILWNGFLWQWEMYLDEDIASIYRYCDFNYFMNYKYKFEVLFSLLFCIYFIFLLIFTHIKLKRKFFSLSIIDTIFCPFANFLKLLPYVGKMNVWVKWIFLFCLPTTVFSAFFGVCFDETSMSSDDYIGLSVFYILPTLVLISLSFLYLKYIVLKANPIYHLILLHPEGRKLLREG